MKKYKQIIIANWKMKLDIDEAISLTGEIRGLLKDFKQKNKKVVLCPSFLAIGEVAQVLEGSDIALGAQDVFYEKKGAFTGEISPVNLKMLGCEYVIVGHSERRAMGESDKTVNKKAKVVLENKMVPIICVGETLEEYTTGKTEEVLARQVSVALADFNNEYFILAYEPVWSISTSGSGKVITIEEAIAQIKTLKGSIPNNLNNFDIAYGGSVTADTAANFSKDFGGSLVGGASLEAQSFFDLIKNS